MGAMLFLRFMAFMLLAGLVPRPACYSQGPAGQQPYFDVWTPQQTGITWRHDNVISTRRYLPESMGPGVAIFDYDNDGWMDLYFTNSGPADFFQPAKPLRNALYH